MFTEHRFDPAEIRARAEQARANLKRTRGLSDALGFAAGIIKARLDRNPQSYRAYGPYWWAVKAILNAKGKDLGADTQEAIRGEYRHADDYETLIAAETFRDWYNATQFQGANQFMLDADGEVYTLWDEDMESARG